MAIYKFLWLLDLSPFEELGSGRIIVIMGETLFSSSRSSSLLFLQCSFIFVFISKIRLLCCCVIKCSHAGYDPLPTCVNAVLETASPMDVSVLRASSAWYL